MAIAVHRRQPGIARAFQVAAVDDIDAARDERLAEPGDAQCIGAHQRAAVARADVGRGADQRYRRITTAHRLFSMIGGAGTRIRSEEHTSEIQSLMRISYAVFSLKKKNRITYQT